MKASGCATRRRVALLATTTTLLSSACAPAPVMVLSADPCARFSRLEMTDAQVDDAKRSPESRQTWRPFFNQTNAHNDVFDATCLKGK